MSLNVKNVEVEAMARRLAAVTGETMTTAIAVALSERLERLDREGAEEVNRRKGAIAALARDTAARWVEPDPTVDPAAGLYDEMGLPR
ncbi:MAG TPA: type II toxin-antitoxin system VapB family antitoxin [Acidimicrobiales bacterium]|nr:type II toxin-antitoxin system VapB family antitoxin [Acidimicrobiales bacterium]